MRDGNIEQAVAEASNRERMGCQKHIHTNRGSHLCDAAVRWYERGIYWCDRHAPSRQAGRAERKRRERKRAERSEDEALVSEAERQVEDGLSRWAETGTARRT